MDNVQPGQNLGPYRIISQVGQGGMATVYKAYHAAMDRYVAVKVLPKQLAESAEFSGRFQQEARTIANLEHPHILPVHDYGESEGVTYLVMRFLDAGTLKDRLQTGSPSLAEVDRLFSQLADALAYAHDHGVVHRDLKPSNALVDARGNLFLTDFGIAKLLAGSSQFTSTGAMIGTPAYMSPEQAQGLAVDQRSDIYSLGIILYEMVTGRVPYEAETPLAVVLKHLQEPLPLPSAVRAGVSPAIERVILRALAKEPADRFATVAEFQAAWKQAFQQAQSEAETVRAAPTPPAESETTIPIGATAPTAPAPAAPAPTVSPPPAQPARPGLPIGWIVGGVGVLALLLLVVFAAPPIRRALRSQPEATAAPTSAPDSTAPPEATAPEATPAPVALIPISPAPPPEDTGWTSWVSLNEVWDAMAYGDQVLAWGAGGLTVWNRADGALFRQFTTVEGLPDPQVNDVLVDEEEGVLWIGSENGLARFDIAAEDWVVYDDDDGLDSTSIGALEWMDGYLIVGTRYSGLEGGGLIRFDGARWEALPDFPSAEPSEGSERLSYNVNRLLYDGGALWAGTDNGLGRYDGQTWTRYAAAEGLPGNQIYALTLDNDGVLWVGTNAGVARFNGEAFERFEGGPGTDYGIAGIVQDGAGRYWFSGDNGVWRYDPQAVNWDHFNIDSGDLPVYTLFGATLDADGYLYFGSYGGGLIRYDGDAFTPWMIPNLPRVDGVGGIVPAPDGTLWFVEEYGGLVDRFDPASGEWSPVSLPCDYCYPATFDADGRLWLGGDLGLWIVEGDQVAAHLTTAEGLPSDRVLSLAFDSSGFAWVGTEAGVAIFDGQSVTQILTAENTGFASDVIRVVRQDSFGVMWVGADGSLSRFTPDGGVEHFTEGNPFQGLDYVTALADAQGVLWVATANAGFYRYADGEWQGWPSDSLWAAAAAPDGTVWFGTYYNGALHFDGQDADDFDIEDGLAHLNVTDIHVTPDGTVWFATSGGVSRYEP
jgi:ligand-binding sensor domain-containing protein/tRNA A-37 threonylcarbamoyl transferase component Bud32